MCQQTETSKHKSHNLHGYIILTTDAIPKCTIRNKELSIATYDFFTLY